MTPRALTTLAGGRRVAFASGPSRFATWLPLRLPAHRASSATLAGAYPFLVPPPAQTGVVIGTDAITGGVFCFDPFALYASGELTNPNVLLAGVIGQGKSALAKSLALRSIAAGRRVYVPGDPKGEWAPLAAAVGGVVVTLGPGMPVRLNPLDATDPDPQVARARRLRVLTAVVEATLRRDLYPGEHAALEIALTHTTPRHTVPTVPHVLTALQVPDSAAAAADGTTTRELIDDGRDLVHALRRFVRGDLAGMFDAPTTHPLDPTAPMVVLDLSRLASHEDALAVAMTCASAWLEAALSSTGAGLRWVIYDEAWRLMRAPALVRRMQAQWKLSRAHGIANLLILHRLSDLDAVGAAGSEARALAAGLLADCSTRIVYRQESDQLTTTATALGLPDVQRDLLPTLPRGTGLWVMPRSAHVVHHRLHPEETVLINTDRALEDLPGTTHRTEDRT